MKQHIVKPLVGFDDVKFGMERSQIRALLGEPAREFKKSKFSKMTTDDYSAYHIFYDKDNKFEAVEFFDDVEIKVDSNIVFPISIDSLKEMNYNFTSDGDGFISVEYSIGIYAPGGKAESILFGVKGYYL